VINKVTSPQGEEFVLADESVNRVLVKGVTAVLRARTEQLWSTKEGDMFLFADAEGNLDPDKGIGAGFYYKDCRFLSDLVMRVDSHDPLLLSPTRTSTRNATARSSPCRAPSTSAAPG
jgi:N-terminal domain of (some) glycogen debranching enzymes